MAKSSRSLSLKSGLPPGTIVHVGKPRTEPVKLSLYNYGPDFHEEKINCSLEDIAASQSMAGNRWIEVDGIHDTGIVAKLGEIFGIHSLVLEDIANTNQRPKKEDYDNFMYVVIKMIQLDEETSDPDFEQVSFIVGKNFIISFQEKEKDCFESVRSRLRTIKGRTRKLGPDYLLYSLIDNIVDNYFNILEHFGEILDLLEEELVEKPSQETLPKIYAAKRSLLSMRRASWPVRELLNTITRGESPFIQKPTIIYFRDVYDHAVEIIDIIENGREMSAGMIDVYLSSMSNRLNEVMRVLTVITTIFMPLSFIAGIYGMNFEHMPELKWHYGYPISLGVMFLLSVGMLIFFRKRGWL